MSKLAAAFVAPLALAACAHTPAGPPEAVADELRAIGPRIEVARTAAIYAPLLPADLYAGTASTRDIAFGPDEKQKLDVFTATDAGSAPRPVLLFVHGGGFVGGDKHGGTSPLYDNVMTWAARNGMVGVNMNYRLAPAHRWPAGGEDVGLAVAWARANVARFGGDPDRIVLWGHSVGATHVADYIAHKDLQPSGTVGAAGAILTSGQIYDMTGPNVSAAYFGEDQAKYPGYASLPGLVASSTPLLVTSAELDPPAFKAQSAALATALKQAERRAEVVEIPGQSHISEIYAIGTADHGLSDIVEAFVRSVPARR